MKTMKNDVKKFRVICNKNPLSKEIKKKILHKMAENGFKLDKENPDLVIFIGGDGTFLAGCKMTNFSDNIVCVGINSGTLGILQNYDDVDEIVRIIKGDELLQIEEIPILQVTINTKYNKPITLKAINDVCISGDGLSLVKIREWVNNEYHQTFCSSGVIVSSVIGSTGISKDYGAPILINHSKNIIRTIVGANFYKVRNFITNPIVCKQYRMDIENVFKNAKLHIDGRVCNDIEVEDIISITVEYSNCTIKTLASNKNNSRIKLIKNKLL